MLANQTVTREEWLNKFAVETSVRFKELGHKFPRIRISCGFTSAGARGKKLDVIGECWFPAASKDKTHEIFIRPDQATSLEVAAVLVHELCHVVAGPKAGHGKDFAGLARDMYLEGKPTHTNGGADFRRYARAITKRIGKYPHATQRAPWKPIQPHSPHKNLTCPECGYFAKGLVEWLKTGRLTCPLDGNMLETRSERAKRERSSANRSEAA